MGKKGLLILRGVVILIAGLVVQFGIVYVVKSGMVAEEARRDLRALYETMSAPYKLIMVASFIAVPMGIGLTIAGLVMPGSKK